jgi:predicted permease
MQWPWRKAESDLDREVQHHIEMLAEAYQRDGLPREEAMRRARLDFGGMDQVKEECRDVRWWSAPARVWQDVRFGWRVMRTTPAITIAAVVSLALGIGATTTIVTLADVLLWRTLAVPAPAQLGEVFWEAHARPDGLYRSSSGSNFRDGGLQVADFFSRSAYDAMRTMAANKAEVAAHTDIDDVSTSFRGSVTVARLRPVSGNFFSMLGLLPHAGRLLAASDDHAGAVPVAVLTHRFWSQVLGGDLSVIGQAMRINNTAYSIAGVLPETFRGIVPADPTEIYAPLEQSPEFLAPESWIRERRADPVTWWMQVMIRRAPGASEQEVRSILNAAFASTWVARPKTPEATPRIRLVNASRGLGAIRRGFGDPLWILLALVGLVLLITCANIANLLLARAAARVKEVGMRISLGCSKGRLIRQFFTESLLLAAIGGALSIGVAAVLGELMVRLIVSGMEGMLVSMRPDLRSFAATGLITLGTAILFGLYPAFRASRVDPIPAIKDGSWSGGGRARWMPAKALVLVQMSLGVLLVTSAILFTNSLRETMGRETGFERGHVLLFDIRPGEVGRQGERLRQFYLDVEARLGAIPGIEAVSLARTRPMRGGGFWDSLSIPGQSKGMNSAIHHVTPAFMDALGVPLLAGRRPTPQEARSGAKVCIVSEEVVKGLGLEPALGARVTSETVEYEVIGIARQARYSEMYQTPPVSYVPFDYGRQSATVVVRTAAPPLRFLDAIRSAMNELDRDLPLVDIYTMEQQISRTLQREFLFAWLCGSFGVLALVLCAVGLYGLMSHTTARRTPEIGIRMALGASRGDIISQVLVEGMRLVTMGLLAGVPLALYAARVAETRRLLPEGPVPYWTLIAAIAILAMAALAAVMGPALRASAIDPMRAIRRGE